MELSKKELKMIENFRLKEEAKVAKELRLSSLEAKFNEVYDGFKKQINEHLDKAHASLNEAVALSKQMGIPFESDLSPFEKRWFTPKSFNQIWGDDFRRHLLDQDSELIGYGAEADGWEYWNSSSLTC